MKNHFASIVSAAVLAAGFAGTASADLKTELIYTVDTTWAFIHEFPDGYKDTVAWMATVDGPSHIGYRIHYWDGVSTQLIGPYVYCVDDYYPSLHSGAIAYLAVNMCSPSSTVLKYWDGTYQNGEHHIIDISTNFSSGGMGAPSLDNGKIAWSEYDGNDMEVYYWDGSYSGGQPSTALYP